MQKGFTGLVKRWMFAFFDYRILLAIVNLPRYIFQYFRYKHLNSKGSINFYDSYPCLADALPYTPFDAHYFYQAAWLARSLSSKHPELHIDLGSSINMLSVLSAEQKIVFMDYRPLQTHLDGLMCMAGTITALPFSDASIQSLSSLHVLEHVGLGRYGDPLDPFGAEKACKEIARVLSPGGRLYISVPVGKERTCFNAHRIFAPETIEKLFGGLHLVGFALVDDAGRFYLNQNYDRARKLEYGCGMFTFIKK